MHAKELVALASGLDRASVELERDDEVLDTAARKHLMARLEDIADERSRACAAEDFERATRLDDEYERIASEISAAGGRRRQGVFNHAGEKARKAVSKAIAEAIARVAAQSGLAGLARHLESSIRKGQWLSYNGSLDWKVEFSFLLPRK